jgi:hypothetical protein
MSFQQSAVGGCGWRRVDGIDLLRGLSIFLVLMNQVNMRLLSNMCRTPISVDVKNSLHNGSGGDIVGIRL